MDGRTDGQTDEQTDGRPYTDGRIERQTDERTNGRTDEQTNGRTDKRTNEQTDEKSPHSTGLCPLSEPLPKKIKRVVSSSLSLPLGVLARAEVLKNTEKFLYK